MIFKSWINRKAMALASALLISLAFTAHAGDNEDAFTHWGLDTVDPLKMRHSIESPHVTLPHTLTVVPKVNPAEYHVPPPLQKIPESKYGDMVELGRNIFTNTQVYAKRYVGNGLNCSSCHLAEGRKPGAAPLWAAYGMYPMYRNKSKTVVTYEERIQDCFRFSLNGLAPTLDSLEMRALVTYSHWLSQDVPSGTAVAGRGFASINKTRDPQPENGEEIYKVQCAMCHGDNGEGQKHKNGEGYMFPPLWGADSYNKAAGMQKVKTCAQFVKANMPLGQPYTLTDDQSLDVCVYMFRSERPHDPRRSWFMNIFMPVLEG